jgi:glycosyltransferase involved in cell wall biosynthesis
MRPQVTVLIGVYNGEKYLAEAIETVIAQNCDSIEIMVINDGSTDGTEEVIKSYGSKVRHLSQSNLGQPSALNLGLSQVQSPYIAFLDADDLYLPDRILLQVEFLEDNPHVDFVFGSVEQFFCSTLSLEEREKWICPRGITSGYLAAAGLFRKECFERVGPFNEEYRIGSFIDWYMRSQERGLKAGLMSDLVLRRRIHGNNIGMNSPNAKQSYVQIVTAALKRRQLVGRAHEV